MRIKKFQKIICLGLALLSIMVLPCYADDKYTPSNDVTIQRFVWNDLSQKYINEPLEEVYSPELDYFLPSSLKLQYVKTYFYETYPKNFIALTTKSQYFYIGILRVENAGSIQVNDETHNKVAQFIYNTNTFVIEETNCYISIYKLNADVVYLDFIDDGIYCCKFNIISDSDLGFLNQYILFREIDEAVLNITTYTNLLIQNFGKAFTFMTGSALPWVLLGISVSLISFGVYSAKRFL